jgi:DNA adenine methylase
VALFLLIEGYVETISINDVDRSIYAFRYAILNSTNKFINNIRRTEVSLKNWQKQKDIQRRKNKVSLFSL